MTKYIEISVTPQYKRNGYVLIEMEDVECTLRVFSLDPGDWELTSILVLARDMDDYNRPVRWMELDNKHLFAFIRDYLETERDWVDEQVSAQLEDAA